MNKDEYRQEAERIISDPNFTVLAFIKLLSTRIDELEKKVDDLGILYGDKNER